MENRNGTTAPPIGESIDRARSAAETATNDVKQAARDVVSTVKETVKEQAGEMKDKAMGAVDSAQHKAADQARTAAHALRETADGLNGEIPWMKTALNKTADGFDHLTSALNKGDVSQALNAVTEYARRQPALFMGLSVAAGFALARVGKTAIESAQPAETDSDLLLDEPMTPYAGVEV